MKKEVNSPKRFNIPHVYYVPDNRASKCMTMQNLCLSQGLWTACPYSSFCPRQSYACSFLTLSSHTRSSMSLPEAFALPKSLYVPLPSFLCFTVLSTSEITLFSDDLFILPVFFNADSPLKQCLAPSCCSIIVKLGDKSQPVAERPKERESPLLSALPGSLTHPSPPQSSSSSAQ